MYDKIVGPNEAEKALPLYYAASTRERALAAVLAKCDGAIANLRKQATDKFGPEVADQMLRSIDATTTEEINAVRQAFQIIFRESQTLPPALAQVERELGHFEGVAEMIRFIRESKRGINIKGDHGRHEAAA